MDLYLWTCNDREFGSIGFKLWTGSRPPPHERWDRSTERRKSGVRIRENEFHTRKRFELRQVWIQGWRNSGALPAATTPVRWDRWRPLSSFSNNISQKWHRSMVVYNAHKHELVLQMQYDLSAADYLHDRLLRNIIDPITPVNEFSSSWLLRSDTTHA